MFSLDWFKTVPGILITVGVLLLLIALVIFIITSLKDKKREKGEPNTTKDESEKAANIPKTEIPADPANPATVEVPGTNVYASIPGETNTSVNNTVPDITNIPSPVATNADSINVSVPGVSQNVPVSPYIDATQNVSETNGEPTNVYSATPNSVPSVEIPDVTTVTNTVQTPVADNASNPAVQMQDTNVQNEPQEPATPVIPTIDTVNIPETPAVSTVPSVEQVVPEMQDTQAMQQVVPEPVITPTIQETPVAVNTVQDVPATPNVQIYGGASPVINETPKEEVKHEIYGGANPLESTQNIPISEITANNANNFNAANAAAVNNNVSAVNITPEQTVQPAPQPVVTAVPQQNVQQQASEPVIQTATNPANPSGLTSIDSVNIPR